MSLLKLPTCGKNTGMAYLLQSIIGDCFCPNCHKIVYPEESRLENYFIAHCLCGAYIRTYITIDKNGKCGKWEYIDFKGENIMKFNITLDCNDFYNDIEDFDQWLKNALKNEILNKIKNTSEWLKFINERSQKILNELIEKETL